MTDAGLVESQPARLFLSRTPTADDAPASPEEEGASPPGSAIAVVLEGSRPLCIEVQVRD